ncbi:MAG: dihydrofolate reductase [Bacteroidetes bacterium]|nr:dihydrofolate reductase [Bacteroidota bacterium]
MKKIFVILVLFAFVLGCINNSADKKEAQAEATEKVIQTDEFNWNPENFADKKIIRYQIPGFDKLTLQQKKLVYYLTQAGLSGRDIIWDQNYRHNLSVRKALDKIVANYKGDKSSTDWKNLLLYAKNVWFSNGIHHHYSNDKFKPGFSKDYLMDLLSETGITLTDEALQAMFETEMDAKKINQDPSKDLVKGSAVNFYDSDIKEAEVDAYYNAIMDKDSDTPVSYGLNSKIVRNTDGQLEEQVYKADGLFGPAIQEIVKWLEKAVEVAENEPQREALKLLIEYYNTGDLKIWDEYNIAWVQATEGDIDYINSFIEVYNDPKGYTGSYESIIQINDFDASARMAVVSENAQYFEDNSPIQDTHKKNSVVGITYKVVNVAGESGDASPSTPIGVNLPNANWIRAKYGSKSVSLGNINNAYDKSGGAGFLQEFAHDDEEIERSKKQGELASKMHTALHEVIGHASGQLEKGVGTPKETLKNYASPLEEARADLVALYYIMDPKLMEWDLVESLEVGKTEYDSYIKNGLMLQLRRINPGKTIEQAHMRNRATVASWAFEKGQAENVISKVTREGKTYFEINDYEKLRDIFGQLLQEVQRIKSQGDYEAGRNLIENYGVKVDPVLHAEVLERASKLNIPPYGGFINPKLVPVTDSNGEITDVKVEYPEDFTQQMLEYGQKYSFL